MVLISTRYTKHLFYLSLPMPVRHGHCQLLTQDVWRHSIWNASAR